VFFLIFAIDYVILKANMLKPRRKNNYQEFLKKKRKFAKKVKRGKIFKDTDGDGLSDYEEKRIYGTDPRNPDTDGDGMKDGAEVKRGRNPLGPGTFKDLFIPHAGNGYLPRALMPGRLFFHAISIIAMKFVVVAFVLFYPLSAWLSPDMALAESKKIIELTNNLRQAVSLPALIENRQLTQAAWEKVQDMAVNQYFAHVSPSGLSLKNWLNKTGYKYAVAGENLAVGFSGAEEAVAAWKDSPAHYENIVDDDFKVIGAALADGKLNQVNTVFIAQYFAAPTESAAVVQKENSLMIDQPAAALAIKSDQFNKEKVIQIKTTLPANTVLAKVIVNNKKIKLTKEPGKTGEWRGAAVISQEEEKNILKPLIPATVAVENSAGTVSYGKIDWDDVKMIKTTVFEHYEFFKANPAAAMAPIMNLSNFYFKFILILAIIAMLLNFFIEIRKQHPKVIFYSFAFLGLLLAMIIF